MYKNDDVIIVVGKSRIVNENPYFNYKVIENCRVHFILDDLNFKISYYISHGLSRCNVNTKTGDVNCVPVVHQFSFSF